MSIMRGRSSIPTVSPDDLRGDLVAQTSPLFGIVWANPERVGGTPCFFGTRVPIQTLFDYVRAGDPIDEFLLDFPTISREAIDGVLRLAQDRLLTLERAA